MIIKMLSELIPLAVVIFAAVAYLKQLGVKGKSLTLSGFAFGLILGLGYRYAVTPMVTFEDWFMGVIFGLMAGFMATGAYKGGESLAQKAKLQ